jgi:hypothetical protein
MILTRISRISPFARAATAALVFLVSLMIVPAARTATFVVNAKDDGAGGPCDVAHCNLHEAMAAAQTGGPHTIEFDIAASGVRIIPIGSPLPTVVTALSIDGFSQPGSAANTNTLEDIKGVPLIELQSSLPGAQSVFVVAPASVGRRSGSRPGT